MFKSLSFFTAGLPVLIVTSAAFAASVDAPALYLDPGAPQEARVRDLVSRMTLDERASMMNNSTPGVPRLGIPRYDWWSEALHGVANAGEATVFPQAIGLAAMWNVDLQQRIAHTIGIEGRAKFNSYRGTPLEGGLFRGLTFWSPNINIFRDPRWGRGQETYGEDPFLTARLGVAFVRGLQGENPRYLLAAACAKHFAVHSGPESLRHNFDVSPSDADLHETYLPAFEALVREAKVEVVMTAYNSLRGTPCSVNPLLYGKLKDWGFNGHVTSDCGSLTDLIHTYGRAKTDYEASAMAFSAGMNVCCGNEGAAAAQAVRLGYLSEEVVNDRVAGLLRTLFRLGIFDPREKVPFNAIAPEENDRPEHGALALQAARESIVLLKNNGILPLDTKKIRRVAVIGPNASSTAVLVGNYNGVPSRPVTLLAGLRASLEARGVKVDYAHGVDYATRPTTFRTLSSGWCEGEYFNNPSFSGAPAAKRTERPLKFDFGSGKPFVGMLPQGVNSEEASIRWTGEVQSTVEGDYQFIVRGRGGFRLSLDGRTVVDSLQPAAEGLAEVREVRGVAHLGDNASASLKLEYVQGRGPARIEVEWLPPAPDSREQEALDVAAQADLILFAGGISAQLEGEEMQVDYEGFSGGDRLSVELPSLQEKLLERLATLGKPVVFVNCSGSAMGLVRASELSHAVLQAWYPGQAGGTALAEIIDGTTNPSGRLPVTFYAQTSDLPAFTDYALEGRTYRYFRGKALYPFGHGLSFTSYHYSGYKVMRQSDGSLRARVTVRNTGSRDGSEVVQIYARPPAARELRALCGFQRVSLRPGEETTVEIPIERTSLRRWDASTSDYHVPAGAWMFAVGASSADLRAEVTQDL